MFRKANFRILLIVTIGLLFIVLAIKYFKPEKGEKNYSNQLVDLDTALVNSIIIYPKALNFQEMKIFREGTEWKFSLIGSTYNADKNAVNAMLSEFSMMKEGRLAATSEDKWKEFEVTDSTGIRVKALQGETVLTDLVVGKFSYQQPTNPYDRQGKMTSYVRMTNGKNVFAVEGFLNMTFNKDVNQLRNKTLINANKENWTKLVFNYPEDSSFALVKQNRIWMVNGTMADSLAVDKYFNSISRLSSSAILDNTIALNNQPLFSVSIEGNNASAITIEAFPADTINKFGITSSMNLGTSFSGTTANLFTKVFIPASILIPKGNIAADVE